MNSAHEAAQLFLMRREQRQQQRRRTALIESTLVNLFYAIRDCIHEGDLEELFEIEAESIDPRYMSDQEDRYVYVTVIYLADVLIDEYFPEGLAPVSFMDRALGTEGHNISLNEWRGAKKAALLDYTFDFFNAWR